MKKQLIIISLLLISTSFFAQIPNELFRGFKVNYTKQANWNIAVFPIGFADVPSQHRSNFPTRNERE